MKPIVVKTPNEISDLQRGQHACLLYDESQAALEMTAPFVSEGLRANERCVYVVGLLGAARVRSSLVASGLDANSAIEQGALVLADQWEVSFSNGQFDPASMIDYVRSAIAEARQDGFEGLRVVAEMSWALQLGVGHNQLIHYEALGNHLYPDEPLVAVCLYDRNRFPSEVCRDAVRVHPVVVDGVKTLENVFYEPPGAVIDGATATERVDWMMEQLRLLHRANEQRIELARVEAARVQAEASMRAKDELLALLAHELRGPLGTTMAACEAAQARLDADGVNGHPVRRPLDIIARQSHAQARLIEHVLDAARTASGQLPVEAVECDLTALVEEVTELVRTARDSHPVEASLVAGAHIFGDPSRLEQVLRNLLDNAIKFSPHGEPIEVTLTRAPPDDFLLSVRDRGPGIPEAERERVFERYHRLESSRRGLGLGLHLSREIIRMHGGEMHVEEATGGGACFVVRVPRHGPRRSAGSATAVSAH